MFVDARTIEDRKIVTTDVCIVGTGVAGLTMAMEFRKAEFKTCIVESGGEKSNKETHSLCWGENIGIPYYPLDTTRARLLGGTSHLWPLALPSGGMGVRLRPMDPIDFEKRSWVPYSGWPFAKEHLDPFYNRAQKVCKIGQYNYDARKWEMSGRSALPFPEDRVYTTMFQFGLRDVFLKDYTREIEKSENITAYLHSNVLEVETSETASEVTRLKVACLNGKQYFVQAKRYILAMGALETSRLLLLSNRSINAGLGNQNDNVGRFFMEHPHLWCSAFVPSMKVPFKATGLYGMYRKNRIPVMGKFALTEKSQREERLLNFVTSIHPDYDLSYRHYLGYDEPGVLSFRKLKNDVLGRRSFKTIVQDGTIAMGNTKALIRYLYRKVQPHVNKSFDISDHTIVYRLNPMVEQAPNPDSRVILGEEKDRLGQPRIKLDWQLTQLDTYTMTRAQEILDEEFRKAGLGYIRIETEKDKVPKGVHGGWHHMGTTRMHENPKMGVVDPNCRVHGISNLYIGGAAVFPTGGFANPVLTTIALVIRLADHIQKTMEPTT